MNPEIGGHLLDRDTRAAVPRDPHDVLAELLRIRLGHSDILPTRLLLDYAAEYENWVLFTPDASLSLTDLGILLREQRVGEALLTRPLFVKEEWLESEYYRDHLPLEGLPG